MPRIIKKSDLGQNRVDGFYDTPIKTVEYICSKILPLYKPGMKVIDPAVGDGVFLSYLRQNGVRACDLYGYDIDSEKIRGLKGRFPNVRIFDATNPFDDKFDFVVGNPPYNGDESHFVRENRERLERLSSEIGAKNTFSIISYQAIKALKEGGIFSMILSDAFATNSYYKPFRHFLLKNLRIDELLLAPWKLFHGRSADVRTCIITGSKTSDLGDLLQSESTSSMIRLVDRVSAESDYLNPPRVEYIEQQKISDYPNQAFLIGVSKKIRALYLDPPMRLGDVVEGGTGISTGNDKKYLRKSEDVLGDQLWVPYYKNGARQPYWYEPDFSIERDYRSNSDASRTYMIRNEKFFFKEGITCSSVGVRFSAAYLPAGCLFGVNANFFFKDRETLFYTLGLLNSKIAWYFARRVLIRTNNISANYLRLLPYIQPKKALKRRIAVSVEKIVQQVRDKSAGFSLGDEQQKLDELFFDIYGFDKKQRAEVLDFCENFYERL
jgi:hypothetical protein